jgi:hypothetical protein
VTDEQAQKNKRYRGVILQVVYNNHADQLSRMDDLELWGFFQGINVHIGQNAVLSLLQDLGGRGYLTFQEKQNRISGRCEISLIEITGPGRNLVERIATDPAVLIP